MKPKNYSWPEFYQHVIDLGKYSFSAKSIARRFSANRMMVPKWMNVVHAISSEGFGRIKYNTKVHQLLINDVQFRRYFERETEKLPQFFESQVKKDLGSLKTWLPPGALFTTRMRTSKRRSKLFRKKIISTNNLFVIISRKKKPSSNIQKKPSLRGTKSRSNLTT